MKFSFGTALTLGLFSFMISCGTSKESQLKKTDDSEALSTVTECRDSLKKKVRIYRGSRTYGISSLFKESLEAPQEMLEQVTEAYDNMPKFLKAAVCSSIILINDSKVMPSSGHVERASVEGFTETFGIQLNSKIFSPPLSIPEGITYVMPGFQISRSLNAKVKNFYLFNTFIHEAAHVLDDMYGPEYSRSESWRSLGSWGPPHPLFDDKTSVSLGVSKTDWIDQNRSENIPQSERNQSGKSLFDSSFVSFYASTRLCLTIA